MNNGNRTKPETKRTPEMKNKIRRIYLVLAAFTALCGIAACASHEPPAASQTPARPEVWLCAGTGKNTEARFNELTNPDAQWIFTKQHIAGLKVYVDQLNSASTDQLRALANLAAKDNLRIAVELGGCLGFAPTNKEAGAWSARYELTKIDKYYAAGGRVDFLDLDGPISRLVYSSTWPGYFDFNQAADELVNALLVHRAAHPETKYWLLTNFPNWGWKGDVSYHARGTNQQDWGDYYDVIRLVLAKLRAAGIALDGVTVDNPYDYLAGLRKSVNLPDPTVVDWVARVRDYEQFALSQGLTFNLIVNSERGGETSDELFYDDTLRMVDAYLKACGHPTRWFVQSWYPYPAQIVPEDAPYSITALTKAVIERVNGAAACK